MDSFLVNIKYMYDINTHNIKKADIIRFFNLRASEWEKNLVKDDDKIRTILDNANVKENSTVLDVACGTGVLIPYYLERNVKRIVALDIAEEMVRVARSKYSDERVHFVVGDMETMDMEETFDAIVIYDAFPHFPAQEKLIQKLASLLNENGVLTVAHSMSQEGINKIHENVRDVSLGLMDADKLGTVFSEYLTTEKVISDDWMYQVTGRKTRKI